MPPETRWRILCLFLAGAGAVALLLLYLFTTSQWQRRIRQVQAETVGRILIHRCRPLLAERNTTDLASAVSGALVLEQVVGVAVINGEGVTVFDHQWGSPEGGTTAHGDGSAPETDRFTFWMPVHRIGEGETPFILMTEPAPATDTGPRYLGRVGIALAGGASILAPDKGLRTAWILTGAGLLLASLFLATFLAGVGASGPWTDRLRRLFRRRKSDPEVRRSAALSALVGADHRPLFYRISDGLFFSDPGGFVVEANDALAGLLGFEGRDQMLRERVNIFGFLQYTDPVKAVKNPKWRVGQCLRRAGDPLNVESFLVRIPSGAASGLLGGVVIDTAARRREERIQAAMEAAERRSLLKSDYLATLGHEIRTPLTVISAVGELLEKTWLEPGQKAYVEKVRVSANGLLELIDDLIDLAKMEHDKLDLVFRPFLMGPLLANWRRMIAGAALKKGIHFTCHAPPIPQVLSGDSLRLRQILTNLAFNAIKFTGPGGDVSLTVEVVAPEHETKEGQRMILAFTVADTGIGIAPEKLPTIFEEYTQVEADTSEHYGGSGLGLSLSLRLARLMGGWIKAESTPGKGSRFRLQVPFPLSTEPLEAPAEAAPPARSPAGLRVLLVDDHRLNRELTRDLLSGLGVETEAVDSGPRALEALASAGRYDMVLMDIQMQGMDGFETARAIRAEPAHADLPIVAVSAHTPDLIRDRVLASGMNDLYTKPVSSSGLSDLLTRLVPAVPAPPDPPAEPPTAPPELADLPGVDVREALERLRGNVALFKRLLTDFVDDFDGTAEKVRQHLHRGDREEALRILHTAKGVAGNCSAVALCAAVDRLRKEIREGRELRWAEHLEQLEGRMEQLRNSVARFRRPAAPAPARGEGTPKAPIPDDLAEKVRKLLGFLDRNNLLAEEVLEEIREPLARLGYEGELALVEEPVSRLDFNQAHQALALMAEAAGLAWEDH